MKGTNCKRSRRHYKSLKLGATRKTREQNRKSTSNAIGEDIKKTSLTGNKGNYKEVVSFEIIIHDIRKLTPQDIAQTISPIIAKKLYFLHRSKTIIIRHSKHYNTPFHELFRSNSPLASMFISNQRHLTLRGRLVQNKDMAGLYD